MAHRGRRKKAGLMREDAARDAMRAFGFDERVIKVCIKELLELYDGEWFLIEEFSYSVLLNKCLEKQAEQDNNNVAAEEEEEEMAEEQIEEMAQEEEEEEEEVEEQEQHVEDGRDHVGSNSTSLVGCDTETGEASVIDYGSPFQSLDYAHHSVGGAQSSGCGWLSDEEDSVVVDDDDDEMIQLTPEPLCEELKELLREVLGEKKRKRSSRWDT